MPTLNHFHSYINNTHSILELRCTGRFSSFQLFSNNNTSSCRKYRKITSTNSHVRNKLGFIVKQIRGGVDFYRLDKKINKEKDNSPDSANDGDFYANFYIYFSKANASKN